MTIGQQTRSRTGPATLDIHGGGEIRLTALEVVLSINTLIRFLGELRASKDATGGITVFTQNIPLPLIGVALAWGLAGAGGEQSTFPIALLVWRLANTLSAVGSVTVVAGEVTGVVPGTNQGRMVGAITVASLRRYLRFGSGVRQSPR